MLPDRVLNPGPLTYESGALPIALRGPAPKLYGVKVPVKLMTPYDGFDYVLMCIDVNFLVYLFFVSANNHSARVNLFSRIKYYLRMSLSSTKARMEPFIVQMIVVSCNI